MSTIKNATIYRISKDGMPALVDLEEALQPLVFTPIGATQSDCIGFIPPRGKEHGPLVESVAGHWILRARKQTKAVPAQVLQDAIDARCAKIEAQDGRKPGKKERKEIKQEVVIDLLPQAFPKTRDTLIWIDPATRSMVLDTATQGTADQLVTLLVEAVKGFALALLDTQTSPQAAMAHWLMTQEAPAGWSIDRACELKASDESHAVVRYGSHPLDIDEVRQHIEHGKLPTRLALTYDDRISIVLTESLQLKKIEFLDAVMNGQSNESEADEFDTNIALTTGELARLLPSLIDALGGEGRTGLGEGLPASLAESASSNPDKDLRDAIRQKLEAKGLTLTNSGGTIIVTRPAPAKPKEEDSGESRVVRDEEEVGGNDSF